MVHVNDRIEEAKKLLGELAKDAQEGLTLTQMTIVTVEESVKRIKKRVADIEKLFGPEEYNA